VPQRGASWTLLATHTCFDRHDAAFSVSHLQEQNDLSRRAAQIVRMQSRDLQLAADHGQIDGGVSRAREGAAIPAGTWPDDCSTDKARALAHRCRRGHVRTKRTVSNCARKITAGQRNLPETTHSAPAMVHVDFRSLRCSSGFLRRTVADEPGHAAARCRDSRKRHRF
jgi:hypothetical protein